MNENGHLAAATFIGQSRRDGRYREKRMKTGSMIIGVLAVLMGLLWIGQGAGLIRVIPSFMIDQQIWVLWGILLASVGTGLVVYSRRH